jgi:hypothetical protein
MKPNYYAIIPANVRYSKELTPNSKLLYGEITALCNQQGFCWASNEYFAELYGKDIATISRWISALKNGGFISIKLDQKSTQKRKIYLENNVNTSMQKSHELLTKTSIAHDENVNSSIYSINNTINIPGKAVYFLISKYPIRWEQEFLMRYEKQFKTEELYNQFLEDFNDEVVSEDKKFGGNLFGFLTKYARNWISYRNNRSMKVLKNEVGLGSRPELKKIG